MTDKEFKREFDNEEHEAYIREHGDIQPEKDEDFDMILKPYDRKKLWGRAAAKCSKCNRDLFLKEESDTNIGKECHISSEKPDIPSKEFTRYNPDLTDKERNRSYDNAILLCGPCHDTIDDPKNTQYIVEKLSQIKTEHEADIAKKLTEDAKKLELEQKMIIHSKKLANEELKPMTRTHIGFDFHGELVNKEPEVPSDPDPTYENYYSEVNEHLKKGYPEIWGHKTKSDIFIENHNKLLLGLLKETTDKVLNEIKKGATTLVGWDGEGQRLERYFSTKYIIPNIQGVIQSSYDKMFDIDTYCCVIHDENTWKVIIDYHLESDMLFRLPPYKTLFDGFLVFINGTSLAESHNESEIIMIKQTIISILKDAFKKDDFSRLKIYKKDAETEYNLFLKGISIIIKKIEHNIPLKDKCEICKNY